MALSNPSGYHGTFFTVCGENQVKEGNIGKVFNAVSKTKYLINMIQSIIRTLTRGPQIPLSEITEPMSMSTDSLVTTMTMISPLPERTSPAVIILRTPGAYFM